jgi:hypothetical protein
VIAGVLDREIRRLVYERTIASGAVPKAAALAEAVGAPPDQVRASLERLAETRVLVLDRDTREILMAMPFAAVKTPFLVRVGAVSYYANCAWDAFGIPPMLGQPGSVETGCGCCSSAMTFEVRDGGVTPDEGVMHFTVPAARFWDNIVFT